MNINIETNFLNNIELDKIEIKITADKPSKELSSIINTIQNISEKINLITAKRENNVYVLNVNDIEKFYSKEKNTYCFYNNQEYKIKKRLYELENLLDSNLFLRISNSCIINIEKIDCFDMGIVGNTVVKFKDGTFENVSKRKLSTVIQYLNERCN